MSTLRALKAIGYSGALSLELSSALANPSQALRDSRDILMRTRHQAWLR